MHAFRLPMLSVVCIVLSLPGLLNAQCGVERWDVKTGIDFDAPSIDLTIPPTTAGISDLISFNEPSFLPPDNRIAPAETTVWVLSVTLVEFKLEADSDYHLVLQDNAGNTMIAEIPSPDCVDPSSPFLAGIQNARSEFDAVFQATTGFQSANVPVQVTGVGMFDFPHGQTGAAPNQIELHPVIDIAFL